MDDVYRCIRCHQQVWRRGDGFACSGCSAAYPEIEGVGLFVVAPGIALRAYLADFAGITADFQAVASASSQAADRLAQDGLQERAARTIAGMTHDLALMRSTLQPVESRMREWPETDDLVAWASVQTGMSFRELLDYFHQDWFGVPGFEAVKALFRDAAARYCHDAETVAVLGAGACGLAHAMASCFRSSYAVDLSLPALLLARSIIAGRAVTLHLERTGWRPSRLAPPPPLATGSLEFVTANVVNLPFRDGSMSAVTTQYFLDSVDNPIQLAEEIHRVLKLDGIWINFSPPFRVPGDPAGLGPREFDEVAALMQTLGFEGLERRRTTFSMLNVQGVDPGAPESIEAVHWFVVRKTASRAAPGRFRLLRQRFLERDPAIWEATPVIIEGRELVVSHKKCFSSEGFHEWTGVGVNSPHSIPILPDHAFMLEALFRSIDGSSTMRDVFRSLERQQAGLSEQWFLELMRYLSVDRLLIELS